MNEKEAANVYGCTVSERSGNDMVTGLTGSVAGGVPAGVGVDVGGGGAVGVGGVGAVGAAGRALAAGGVGVRGFSIVVVGADQRGRAALVADRRAALVLAAQVEGFRV